MAMDIDSTIPQSLSPVRLQSECVPNSVVPMSPASHEDIFAPVTSPSSPSGIWKTCCDTCGVACLYCHHTMASIPSAEPHDAIPRCRACRYKCMYCNPFLPLAMSIAPPPPPPRVINHITSSCSFTPEGVIDFPKYEAAPFPPAPVP